jgi:hypothetical protein
MSRRRTYKINKSGVTKSKLWAAQAEKRKRYSKLNIPSQ